MANHASALKAHRQSLKHRERNRGNRKALRTTLKDFNDQASKASAEISPEALSKVYATIDKAARKGALSRNAAARQKSRLTKRINAAKASPAKS